MLWKLKVRRGWRVSNGKEQEVGVHWPGIEPGPPAWQARILPLNHQCLREIMQPDNAIRKVSVIAEHHN